jgi:hypothetical protein
MKQLIDASVRFVKYQRNNQKPFIEKGQTMPCPKERKKTTKRTNNDLQNTTQKTKD